MSPEAIYARRAAELTAEAEALGARSRALSNARLVSFLAGVACLLTIVFTASALNPLWAWGAAGAFGVFLILVRTHDRVIRRERHFRGLVRIQREGLARLERRWGEMPRPEAPEDLVDTPEARDLNLFGPASVFHLLGTVATPPGRETLARWLTAPAPPAEIRRRQEAVRELAGAATEAVELRQHLQLAAREMAALGQAGPFLEWAESPPWLLPRSALRWLVRGMAAASVGLLAGSILGPVPWSLWALVALANLGLDYLCARRVHGILDRVEAREVGMRHYAQVFEVLSDRGWQSDLLRQLGAETAAGGLPARRAMDRLGSRVVLADARHSSLVHMILEALLLWDFHVLEAIERWQVRHGRHARRWLLALGQLEALAALATLRFENPGWSFPEVVEGEPARVVAAGLGHPLLPGPTRVDNDVELGPPGTFLLVTGSNMSGKSTLLRALGTNLTLAQAGGPVCATSLVMPPIVLGTSLLIEDSLTSGVSFFMAELKRLKAIVDRADASREEGSPTLLFLLDEVLRGTNSAERRIAVERVLRHLMEAGAIGAVTTHDLALAEVESLATAARPVHFRETLQPAGEGPPMTFDYRLRQGLATTTNALRLLALVGLDDDARR